jgi:hypothetical protein
MQRYTIFFSAVSALHVSGDFSSHHHQLKIQNCTHSIWYVLSLLAATASVDELELENTLAMHGPMNVKSAQNSRPSGN